MYNWLRRHKGALIFALSVTVFALIAANAWKHEVLTSTWLKEQKDALAALNSIVTLLVFLAASIFSYYRFFRGRTLSLRSELTMDVSVHTTPNEHNLHAFALTAKNVGTSTIWNPKPEVQIAIHGPPDVKEHRTIDIWYEEKIGEEGNATVAVIEADETVSFTGQQLISKSAWAVTYSASLKADSGDVWYSSKTVSNKEGAN